MSLIQQDPVGSPLTDQQKSDLANHLNLAWRRYTEFFGESPHGTHRQLMAMLELAKLDKWVADIERKAIARWYVEGHR